MANINQSYQAQTNSIASYDWQDLASGLSYNIYYGCKDAEGNYLLIDNSAVFSDSIGEGDDETYTLTFDTSIFNVPREVKGKAFMSVPISTTTVGNCYAVGSLYHYDGTTETILGSGSGVDTPTGNNATKNQLLTFDIAQKHFKKGDILRAKVQIVQLEGVADINYTAYDPQGRTYVTASAPDIENSQLIIHIPFKIND